VHPSQSEYESTSQVAVECVSIAGHMDKGRYLLIALARAFINGECGINAFSSLQQKIDKASPH